MLTISFPVVSDSSPKKGADDLYLLAYTSFVNQRNCQTLNSDYVIKYAGVFIHLKKILDHKFKSEDDSNNRVEIMEAVVERSIKTSKWASCSDETSRASSATIDTLIKVLKLK